MFEKVCVHVMIHPSVVIVVLNPRWMTQNSQSRDMRLKDISDRNSK